jgi:hypothetical protein
MGRAPFESPGSQQPATAATAQAALARARPVSLLSPLLAPFTPPPPTPCLQRAPPRPPLPGGARTPLSTYRRSSTRQRPPPLASAQSTPRACSGRRLPTRSGGRPGRCACARRAGHCQGPFSSGAASPFLSALGNSRSASSALLLPHRMLQVQAHKQSSLALDTGPAATGSPTTTPLGPLAGLTSCTASAPSEPTSWRTSTRAWTGQTPSSPRRAARQQRGCPRSGWGATSSTVSCARAGEAPHRV